MMNQRKGITPIIAVVLLLMMTVAAAGLAYQFVIGTQTDVQEGVRSQVVEQQTAASAKLSIDSVYNGSSGVQTNTLGIVVRNAGTYTFSAGDFKIYLSGKEYVVAVPGAPAATMAPKSTTTLSLTAVAGTHPTPWPNAGQATNIRIVPVVGSAVSYTCTNSGQNQFC